MSQPVDAPVSRWMKATSPESLERAAADQRRLAHGRMNHQPGAAPYTQAGLSREHYDALRYRRDDLDYREWNAATGFSGVDRWPTGPGMAGQSGTVTTGERRRRARRAEIEEGF